MNAPIHLLRERVCRLAVLAPWSWLARALVQRELDRAGIGTKTLTELRVRAHLADCATRYRAKARRLELATLDLDRGP